MKKLIRFAIWIAIFIGLFGMKFAVSASAESLQDNVQLSFAELGKPEIIMHGPYDADGFDFSVAPNWALQGEGELQLSISTFFAGDNSDLLKSGDFTGALLDVYFNGKLQQSVPLQAGSNILYRVPIAPEDLASRQEEGRLDVYFFLNASIDCDFQNRYTTVAISPVSQIYLPYTVTDLQADLHRLPWPFYQKYSLIKGSTVVVIPVEPTADELQAALITMGALGRMTNHDLPASLISVDKMTDEIRNRSDVIFVGKPTGLPIASQVSFPVPLQQSRFSYTNMQSDDGILQLVTSPWNSAKALMMVSGNSDAGVVKAAQALSTGNLQTDLSSTYSIISQVNPNSYIDVFNSNTAVPDSSNHTLAEFGHKAHTLDDVGVNKFFFEFIIPPGQIPTEKPYFDFVFSNSSLVDPERSGVIVLLNSNLVGSVKLSTTDAEFVTSRIQLPLSSLVPGKNIIEIDANLIPTDQCSISSFKGLWLTVFPESTLHLPLARLFAPINPLENLQDYPYPFTSDPSVSTTAFILPKTKPNAWSVAGTIAYNLASHAAGGVVNFDVEFDGQLSAEIYHTHDLIIVGIPNELQSLKDLAKTMPATFEDKSNIAVLESQQVIYRISTNKSIGYLELFPAPWNDQLTILTILGTTPQGLDMAGAALVDDQQKAQLQGNFATVDGSQIQIVDTRTGLGIGRLSTELGDTVTVDETSVSSNPENSQALPSNNKTGILVGLVAVAALMFIVIVIAILLRRRNPQRN